MGFALIFLSEPWLAASVALIYVLVTGHAISTELFLLIGYAFPLSMLCWLLVFTDLKYEEKKKLILSIYLIYYVANSILFFIFLFTDSRLIGVLDGPINHHMGPYLIVRSLIGLTILLVTSSLFFKESRKSENPEVRFKGKLIFIGIVLFIIGGIAFTITGAAYISLSIFIPSLIALYGGFALPDWMKKIFLKKKE